MNDVFNLTNKPGVDPDIGINQGEVIASPDSTAKHKLHPVFDQGMNAKTRM